MPEVAEVRLIADNVSEILTGKTLTSIEYINESFSKKAANRSFTKFLSDMPVDLVVTDVSTKGKFSWISLSDGSHIGYGLGLSGNFRLEPTEEYLKVYGNGKETRESYLKHALIKITYDDDQTLYYHDVRHFGNWSYYKNQAELNNKLNKLGYDVMDELLTKEELIKLFARYKHEDLTKVIMGQKVISGIGNYMKAETFYANEIHPNAKVGNLTDEELYSVYKYAHHLAHEAYNDGGASLYTFTGMNGDRSDFKKKLKVYDKKFTNDQHKHKVVKMTTTDKRSTHWVKEVQVKGLEQITIPQIKLKKQTTKVKTVKPKPKIKVKTKVATKPTLVLPYTKEEMDAFDLDSLDVVEKPTQKLLDLRIYAGRIKDMDRNEKIISILEDLVEHTKKIKAATSGKEKANHARRINAFINGIAGIREYPHELDYIWSTKTAAIRELKKIEGIGAGIAKRIEEILRTGNLAELEDTIDPRGKIAMELEKITGIGDVKAKQLIDTYGITGVDDLRTKYQSGELKVARNQLTHHIALGLEYYDDFNTRMEWSEVDLIKKLLTEHINTLNPELIVQVCGSYRRHKTTCGDIDVLVTHPEMNTDDDISSSSTNFLGDIVDYLTEVKFLVGNLTDKGKTKYMGVCVSEPGTTHPGRRIDIRFVPQNSFGAAVLYFTGSGRFNKIMRFEANKLGYTINEYGIYRLTKDGEKGEQIPTANEKEIFTILNIVYLEPTEREF